MKTEALTAAPAPAQAETKAYPFLHVPRPARVPNEYRRQRYYGANETQAIIGQKNCGGTVRVRVLATEPGQVGIEIDSMSDGLRATIAVSLGAEALLEVARCLIDAAADIENQGGAA